MSPSSIDPSSSAAEPGALAAARPSRFAGLDGIRGLAALAVVLYHLGFHGPQARAKELVPLTPAPIRFLFVEHGGLGVAVFFALSGFVLSISLRSTRLSPVEAVHFMKRRCKRLIPPYYAALILAILVAGASAVVSNSPFELEGEPFSFMSLLAHLVFLQSALDLPQISSVFWTLCAEMFFYLAFALILMGVGSLWPRYPRQSLWFVLVPVSVLSLVAATGAVQGDWLPVPWLTTFAAFLLGAFTAWALLRRIHPAVPVVFGVAYLLTGWWGELPFKATVVGSAALFVLVTRVSTIGRILDTALLRFLGRISYSWYLTHSVVLSAVYFLVEKSFGTDRSAQLIYALAGIGATVVAATILQRLVEAPSIRWAKNEAVIAGVSPQRATDSLLGSPPQDPRP